MIQKPQSQAKTVRDPVCGMTIETGQVFATRTLGEETFSFCSERCVQQFDREHAGSATTGVSAQGKLQYIELPIVTVDGQHSTRRLEEHLSTLAGVRKVTANTRAKLVRVTYDSSEIQVDTLVKRARAAGYTIGLATTQLDIQGMHCASCVVTIEQALQRTPGVLTASDATGPYRVYTWHD